MMFEVQDLAVASPATVSRCGMVYLEPSILGLKPFVSCWMQKLPDCIFDHREKLDALFENFLEVLFTYLVHTLQQSFASFSLFTFSRTVIISSFIQKLGKCCVHVK